MDTATFALTDLPERMQSKISLEGECWTWTGAKNPKGYGSMSAGTKNKSVLAHRMAYTIAKGEIPEGMQIDHRCRNTSCVNPSHLDAVTAQENVRRRYEGIEPRVGTNFSDIFQKFWGSAEKETERRAS